MKKVFGVTGHRFLSHDTDVIIYSFLKILEPLSEIDSVITGMAIGYDQLVAEICLAANIRYIAAVPFIGQEKKWPKDVQKRYHELLNKAYKIHVVSEGGYAAWKMHARNEWIVNNSDILISYFDGNSTKSSGTAACISYAKKVDKKIINIYNLCRTI